MVRRLYDRAYSFPGELQNNLSRLKVEQGDICVSVRSIAGTRRHSRGIPFRNFYRQPGGLTRVTTVLMKVIANAMHEELETLKRSPHIICVVGLLAVLTSNVML